MSKKIDERVVEMRFDNKQFESATATTMSTLDKLKQKLNFTGATKGLNDVGAAAKTTERNMSPLASAVQTVETRFSALQVMGVTALANITNSAVNAGKRIVSALTIDPVKTGLQEYETQMNAVQTILANTQSKGSTLEDVNRALAELNEYADQTIYNFTEMTRNIGTFTAAGVDLDKSVTSIKGIANLAAVSGSNAQQASTAMYQLSQALAAGRVSLMDWNSVVNAGMGGEVFQTALKRTAEHFGTNVDAMIKKYGSFRESLTQGGWLTTEVLTETLTQLSGAYSKADLIAQGYTEKQAEEIYQLAQTAVGAATDVKTFTGMMDTLKESLQSGWAQSWQTIIGDFEQAKELWSRISKIFGDVIQGMSDARNALLGGALDSNWEKLTDKVTEAGVSVEDFNDELEKTARAKVDNFDEIIKKSGSLAEAFQDGSLSSDLIVETLKRMGGVSSKAAGETEDLTAKLKHFQEVVDEVWKGNYKNSDTGRIELLTKAGYDYAQVQELVNKTVDGHRLTLEDLNETQLKSIGYTDEEVSALKELALQAEETGTPINKLIEEITKPSGRDLLWEGIINILESLIYIGGAVKAAWDDAFSIDAGGLYSIIEAFNAFTKALKPSEETLKGLTSTLKGLFAILDIIVSVIGGVTKTVFGALATVLGTVDFNILSITGSVGESIAAFRDWLLEGGTLTNVLSKLGDIIVTVATAVKDFIKSFGNFPIVKNAINTLRNGLADLPKIGQWIVDGLQNGLVDGITSIPKTIVSIATSILDTFKKILGINSPSKETYEIGKFTIEGFLKGFTETAGKVFAAIGDFGKQLVSTISGIVSSIDWSAVFAVAFSGGLLYAGIKVSKAIEQFSAPFEDVGDVLSGVGNVLDEFADNIGRFSKSITKYINAKAFAVRADAVQTLAISLAIVAASLLVLSQIPWQKLLVGLGGLLGVAVILGALSVAISKFGPDKSLSFLGFGVAVMSIATSLTVVSAAIKILDSLDPEKSAQTLNTFVTMLTAMMVLLTVLGVVSKIADAKAISKMGSLMIKLSIALAAMAGVVKLISLLDNRELVKGGVAIAAFAAIITAMVALTKLDKGQSMAKMSGLMLSMSVSLLLMVGVVKLISLLTVEELIKGGIAIAAFALIIKGMVQFLTLGNDQTMAKVGTTLLAMSASMLLMVAVVKLMGTMSVGEIVKGGLGIAAFAVVIKLLVTSLKGFDKEAPKIAGTLLAMSLAIGILAAVAITLSLISIPGLIKGVTAVGLLGVIMSLMAASTRYASDVKGTMIAMAIAIGIMAAAVAGLSFIDPTKLAGATAAIGVLMGMFSIILLAGSNVNSSISVLITMSAAIAVLGGIVYLLSTQPVESVITSALAISTLLLALAASMKILNGVGKISASAIVAIGVLTVVVAGIAAILGALDYMNVEPSIETATAISILLATMSGVCLILAAVGKTGIAAVQGAAALDAVILVILALMATIGSVVSYFPFLEEFVDKGIDLLEAVGQGIGGFVGGIIGGVLSGITSTLPDVATDLSTFMTNLTPFIEGAKQVDDSVLSSVKNIASMIVLLSAANFINGLTNLFSFFTGGGSFASLAEDLVPFGEAMAEFGEKVASIDPETVNAAANAGMMIAELSKSLPREGGLLQSFFGSQDLGTFSEDMSAFGEAIVAFSEKVAPGGKSAISAEAVTAAANAGKTIADLNANIPASGGALQSFLGEKDLGKFATDMGLFADAIVAFSKKVAPNGTSVISEEAVTAAANAGMLLSDLNKNLPSSGGFLQRITGEKSMADFGTDLMVFGESLSDYAEEIKDLDPNVVTASANAASALVELADAIPNSGGLLSLFSGDNDFETFGTQLSAFGTSFSNYYDSIKSINMYKLNSVVGEIQRIVSIAKGMSGVDFSAMGAFGRNLKTLGNSGVSNLISAFEDASSRVQTAGSNMVSNIIIGANNKVTDLKKTFTSILNQVITVITVKANEFKSSGSATMVQFIGGVNSQNGATVAKFSEIIQKVLTAIRGQYENFRQAGVYLVDGMASGIQSNSWKAEQEARKLATTVTNVTRKALGEHSPSRVFYGIGEYVVEGMVNGIDATLGSAVDIATTLGKLIVSASKQALGINSPSTVMRDEVGRYIVMGIAEGITEDMSAEEAASQKAQNIVNAFKSAFDSIDLSEETANLEYELWQKMNPDATDYEKANAEIDSLQRQLGFQSQRLENANAEYQATLQAFGASSTSTQEAYNKLLEEQISLTDMIEQINTAQSTLAESNRQAFQAYSKWLGENQDVLLGFGYSMEQIEAAGQRETGWDPSMSFMADKLDIDQIVGSAMKEVEVIFQDNISTTTATLAATSANVGTTMATAISTGVQTSTPQVAQSTTAMVQSCAQGIMSERESWIQAANDLIDAFVEGIQNGTQRAVDAAKEMASQVSTVLSTVSVGSGGSAGYDPNPEWQPGTFLNPVRNMNGTSVNSDKLNVDMSAAIADGISTALKEQEKTVTSSSDDSKESAPTYQFTQNNYSPKSLSRIEIYRQTKNQLSAFGKVVSV